VARTRSRQVVVGVVLVAIGAILLAVRLTPLADAPAWLLGLGLAFGILGVVQRSYAGIVAGCVLLGLGAGMVLGDRGGGGVSKGNWLLLALGLGFVAIYLVDLVLRLGGRWWPLVPGIVLVGLAAARGVRLFHLPPSAEAFVRTWWPAGLVIVGLWVLLQGLRR